MPVCPNCKSKHSRRKYGTCPTCGEQVRLYQGRWYLSGCNSPSVEVLEYFEHLVSKRQAIKRNILCSFRIPRKGGGYEKELVFANRLLGMTDGDISLVKDALWQLFNNRQFSWKTYTSLTYLQKDFVLALVIARARNKSEKERQAQEHEAINRLTAHENVFVD